MHPQYEKLLDRIGLKILAALQENARIPLSRLGDAVGLSAPAVAERVKKLEEAGIIKGYHARIDPALSGAPILAFITLTTETGRYPAVKDLAEKSSRIFACHHISGEASFILQVRAVDMADLEDMVARLSTFGATRTAIVLSTTVDKSFEQPLAGLKP